jgi:hypothetical protein
MEKINWRKSMSQIKRHRIDWDNIKITIVPADKDNPNPLNPYARMSPEEREEAIISKSAEILVQAVKNRITANKTTL